MPATCSQHVSPAPLSRRDMLRRCANGFGAVALAALLGDKAYGAVDRNGVSPITALCGKGQKRYFPLYRTVADFTGGQF